MTTMLVDPQAIQKSGEIVEKLKKDKARNEKRKAAIIKARSKTCGILSMSSKLLDAVASEFDKKTSDDLKEAADHLGNAVDIIEKTTIVIGLIKNANTYFWLALVAVIVSEARSSLIKQGEKIDQMRQIVLQFKSNVNIIVSLLGGVTDQRALLEAQALVKKAREHLVEAKIVSEKESSLITYYTDLASINLNIAEEVLRTDIQKFNEIPSYAQFAQMAAFIQQMLYSMALLVTDFSIFYAAYSTLAKVIINIKENVMKTKKMLDMAVVERLLKNIIKSLDRSISNPMKELFKKWEKDPPGQATILWNELKYAELIDYHGRMIESYFGANFRDLVELDQSSEAYATLVENIQNDPYTNGKIDPPSDVKKAAVRITAPVTNLLSLGKKSASSIYAMIDRTLGILDSISSNISNTKAILDKYGSYESSLLSIIERSLKALGYNKPLTGLASGNLMEMIPTVSGNLQPLQDISAGGTTITGGIAMVAGKLFNKNKGLKEKNVETALMVVDEVDVGVRFLKKKRQDKKMQQLLDAAADEEDKLIKENEQTINIIDSGINKGQMPLGLNTESLEQSFT